MSTFSMVDRYGRIGMLRYITRRLLIGLLTLAATSVLSFVIIQLPPGDYVTTYIAQLTAEGGGFGEAQAETLRMQYGLDQPVYVQYLLWIGRILQRDFGHSLEWGRPVAEIIGNHMAMTIVVAGAGVILTWLIALPIGIYSAVNQYSVGDYIFTLLGFVGLAVPSFLLALLLMYFSYRFFGADIGGLFSSEYVSAPWSPAKLWDLLVHLPIPAIVLGVGGAAEMIRIMRANLLDELRKPYVTTARARGVPEATVILKYPVRVALNPFVSTIGYLLPHLVSGSIIISLVLNLPTVGPLLLRSLLSQDMFMAGAIVLLLGLMTIIGTLVSDLLLMWVDPRIRMGAR